VKGSCINICVSEREKNKKERHTQRERKKEAESSREQIGKAGQYTYEPNII
jgi:hypothetical protein